MCGILVWYNLDSSTAVSKSVTCLPRNLTLVHWLPWRSRVLFMYFEMITQILWCHFAAIHKRKNALLNFDCDPWIGSPYSWCFLPHTPFSCCSLFCSFTLKSRISCDRLAILNGMGWGEQRPSCYDIFLFFVLASCFSLKSNLKDIAKFDLSLIL